MDFTVWDDTGYWIDANGGSQNMIRNLCFAKKINIPVKRTITWSLTWNSNGQLGFTDDIAIVAWYKYPVLLKSAILTLTILFACSQLPPPPPRLLVHVYMTNSFCFYYSLIFKVSWTIQHAPVIKQSATIRSYCRKSWLWPGNAMVVYICIQISPCSYLI